MRIAALECHQHLLKSITIPVQINNNFCVLWLMEYTRLVLLLCKDYLIYNQAQDSPKLSLSHNPLGRATDVPRRAGYLENL